VKAPPKKNKKTATSALTSHGSGAPIKKNWVAKCFALRVNEKLGGNFGNK
jgi:hypothetical protein